MKMDPKQDKYMGGHPGNGILSAKTLEKYKENVNTYY